ncbi:hypothetical protein [Frigoribacterium sp. UYMn621]|uniref:hypothetical protein n=1 Tax=Frigoribacterium sp. UYMn621 TaxID=3156343 RepID=UPI003397704E
MNSNMERERVIYGLHVGDFSFGYIGSTEVNARTRWWEHRSRARKGHGAPVYAWMRKVGVDRVQYSIIHVVRAHEDILSVEADVIARHLAAGHPLANEKALDGIADSMSAASRARIGIKAAGKPTWIKGLTGEAAGWTPERRAQQASSIRARNAAKLAA